MRIRTWVLAASFTGLCFSGCSCGSGPDTNLLAPDGAVSADGAGTDGGRADAGDAGERDAAVVDGGGLDASVPCVPEAETCDGTDQNCNGLVDDGIFAPCGSDEGACVSGQLSCVDGMLTSTCVGEVGPVAESCNGLDDDCNMMIDETCPCTPDGIMQPCGSDVGECTAGTQTCATGSWGACVGEVVAEAELCNALDDDCDGATDENFAGLGAGCDGADADLCAEGTTVCLADGSGTTCDDVSGDTAEACNTVDDDCDGMVDEGCTCTDGTTQPCGTDVGECAIGMQTCAGGVWGACAGGAGPTMEVCDALDQDCDGASDNGLGLGTPCDGGDADLCLEGVTVCDASGGTTCGDATGDSVELCNAMDDDCDGMTDEGLGLGAPCDGPDADMCLEGVAVCDASGGVTCDDATADNVEICNGADDDCDGMTDEGNPGGGVICAGAGADVGACVSRTACVGGALICRGTFVSPLGAAGNPGSPAMPLASISAAIANAVLIGGGADVCVCDTAAAGASTFTEDVTMVEGTSVLGGYDCASWTRVAGRVTGIQDLDANGVLFAAGITGATAMELMSVDGLAMAGVGATTSAVTVTGSSPQLLALTVRAGAAANAVGLRVDAAAAPSVTGGTYSSFGVAGGTAIAVDVDTATPAFNMVTIGAGAAIGPVATTSYGVRCNNCASTSFNAGSVAGGGGTTATFGLYGTGNMAGFSATGTAFIGGQTTSAMSASTGIRLEACTGAPAFTMVNTNGGFGAATGTRTAIRVTGAACAAAITGGRHIGCERSGSCIGIECSGAAPCAVSAASLIQGSVGVADADWGMRCLAGGCASVTGSTIGAGLLSAAGLTGIAFEVDGASPPIDDNLITGPNGGAAAVMGRFFGLYLRDTSSFVTNNVIRDGSHMSRAESLRFDQTALGPALVEPRVHSNTIEYTPCTGCGPRVGIGITATPGGLGTPAGVFRNNLVRNTGAGGVTQCVVEYSAQSDPRLFENNALWDPTGTAVYLDEGTTPLFLAPAINALAGASMNQVVNCMPNATWHIPLGSACQNTGTAAGAPDHDFDPQPRPHAGGFDIGADEN